MNKKVLTLCAGFLLAGAVGTANAQTWAHQVSKATAPSLEAVEQVTDNRAYQLSNGHDVLVMQKVSTGDNAYHYQLAFVPYYEANVGESLWYVQQVKSNNENGVAFQFVNLAYNLPISFDSTKAQDFKSGNFKASDLGGNAIAWSWMRSEAGRDLQIARTPEAYITPDSVMTMVPLADGKVAAVKYATKEVKGKVDDLRIKPFIAGAVWLNKFDLNTMMQTKQGVDYKFQLAFEKGTTTENLWDKKYYKAVDPVADNTLSYGEVKDAEAAALEAQAAWEKSVENAEAANNLIAESNDELSRLWNERGALEESKTEKVKEQNQYLVLKGFAQAKKTDIEDQISSLEEEISSLSNASDEAKNALIALREQKEQLKGQLEFAENQLDTQIEYINATNTQIESLRAELEEANAVKAANQDVIDFIKNASNFSSSTGNFSANQRSVEVLYNKYVKFNEGADKKNDIVSDSDSKDKLTESGYDAFAEYLQKFIEEGKGNTIITFGSSAQNSDNFLASVIADRDDAIGSIASLPTEITEAQTTLRQYTDGLQTLSDNVQNLGQQVADKQADIDAWVETNAANDEQTEAAENKLAQRKADLEEIKSEISDYDLKLKQYRVAIMEANAQIEDLNEQIDLEFGQNWHYIYYAQKARNAEIRARHAYLKTYNYYVYIQSVKAPYWLSLQAEDGKSYLMVDTAYVTENAGDQNLKFAVKEYKEFTDADSPMNARDINGRFNFRFLYYPTQDSLRIEADGFNRKNVSTELWSQRHDDEITLRSSNIPGLEQNLVKVDVLGTQREVTIGNSENLKGTYHYTINDRIGFDFAYSTPDTLPSGLYYMDVEASKDSQRNNARLMVDLDGDLTLVAPADTSKMAFAHMPAAKWVVETQPTEFGGYPSIYNQETGARLNNGNYAVTKNEAGETVITLAFSYQGKKIVEDYTLTPAPSTTLGYYAAEPDVRELFTLNYLNVGGDLNVTVGDQTIANDTVLAVTNGDAVKFELNRVAIEKYGLPYGTDTLKRGIYTINVNDPNKLNLKDKFIQVSNIGGTEMMVVSNPWSASHFYLKEVNDANGAHYYALIEADYKLALVDGKWVDTYVQGDKKAGVVDATGLIKAEDITAETRTSAFALIADTTRYYREFTAEELGDNYNMKFYRTSSTEKEYLYAGAAENGMTFLSVEGKGDNAGTAAELTVIPTTEEGVLMPQYFIARNVTEKAGSVDWCGEEHKALADSLACPHTTVIPDTLVGEFLVNLKIDEELNENNLWENKYTRLAFLKGFAVKPEGTMPGEGQYTTLIIGEDTIAFEGNKHNPAKFEFRLINDDPAQDFLIESESWGYDKDGNYLPFEGGVRPMVKGGWVKVQNGVPVIVADDFEYASQADVYNVDTNYTPTANEEISANAAVSVVATDGAVIVKGAEGKNVIVSTILGKVVANEVLNSDNETIAAPVGIVVVSVDGESFKVAVK